MSLTSEQIVKNAKKYVQTTQSIDAMNDDLLNFLGEDFIKAPASTSKSHFNAFEGGLIDHLLNVTKYAIFFNNSLPEEERADKNSLMKVCLLHQIGKAKLFVPNQSEWHVKNQGLIYQYNNTLVPMRVSERSIYYLSKFNIELTEEEFSAILMYDKVDDKMSEYHNSIIGDLLKSATTFAIKHEKTKYNV